MSSENPKTSKNKNQKSIAKGNQSFDDYFKQLLEQRRDEVFNTLKFADGNNWDNWTWYDTPSENR